MKNFYEATVIKPTLKSTVELTLTPIGSVPCMVKFNGSIWFEDTVRNEVALVRDIGLTDPIDITVQIYRNHPDAVQIALTIDGINIIPKYQHQATPPTGYIDFNHVWSINIPNFHPWYHSISGQGWVA